MNIERAIIEWMGAGGKILYREGREALLTDGRGSGFLNEKDVTMTTIAILEGLHREAILNREQGAFLSAPRLMAYNLRELYNKSFPDGNLNNEIGDFKRDAFYRCWIGEIS